MSSRATAATIRSVPRLSAALRRPRTRGVSMETANRNRRGSKLRRLHPSPVRRQRALRFVLLSTAESSCRWSAAANRGDEDSHGTGMQMSLYILLYIFCRCSNPSTQ